MDYVKSIAVNVKNNMSKKIIGICGDSFMAAIEKDESHPDNGHGKHFTEILAKKLDWDIITYARGGCSNQSIRLQIDEIIKHKPNHVIIGSTTPDRLEIPIPNLSVTAYEDKWTEKNYNPFNGLYNISYMNYNSESRRHEGFSKIEPTLVSETMSNIFRNTNLDHIGKEKKNAIEQYFMYLYDYEWKSQQDSWILSEGLYKLKENKISFDIIIYNLHIHTFSSHFRNVIDNKNPLNPWTYYDPKTNSPYPFHLLENDEILLSNLWFEHLTKTKLI